MGDNNISAAANLLPRLCIFSETRILAVSWMESEFAQKRIRFSCESSFSLTFLQRIHQKPLITQTSNLHYTTPYNKLIPNFFHYIRQTITSRKYMDGSCKTSSSSTLFCFTPCIWACNGTKILFGLLNWCQALDFNHLLYGSFMFTIRPLMSGYLASERGVPVIWNVTCFIIEISYYKSSILGWSDPICWWKMDVFIPISTWSQNQASFHDGFCSWKCHNCF